MNLCFPDLLDVTWVNYSKKLDHVYKIYIDDIYQKLSFFGKSVYCREDPEYDGKHECFWHLMTQDYEKRKSNNDRFPDVHRCNRVNWISFMLKNYSHVELKCWVKPHRKKKGKKTYKENRYYLWSEDNNFVIVLGEQKNPSGFQLITSYCTDKPETIKRFKEEISVYIDPR